MTRFEKHKNYSYKMSWTKKFTNWKIFLLRLFKCEHESVTSYPISNPTPLVAKVKLSATHFKLQSKSLGKVFMEYKYQITYGNIKRIKLK